MLRFGSEAFLTVPVIDRQGAINSLLLLPDANESLGFFAPSSKSSDKSPGSTTVARTGSLFVVFSTSSLRHDSARGAAAGVVVGVDVRFVADLYQDPPNNEGCGTHV
jgi:hypothetical protein